MKSLYMKSFLLLSIIIGCSSSPRFYNREKVKIIDIERLNNDLIIYYRPFLETVYYSPGINYNYTNDSLNINVIRAKINTYEKCMIKSDLITAENDSTHFRKFGVNVYKVIVPNKFLLSNDTIPLLINKVCIRD